MHETSAAKNGRDNRGDSSERPPLSLSLVTVHGVLWLIGIFGMPVMALAQAGVLGVWLAWGRGSIWGRLAFTVVGWLLLSVSFVTPVDKGRILVSMAITTIFAATASSGLGAVLVAQIPDGSRMPVRFRFWELVVGVAALGGAFALVGDRFDVSSMGHWQREGVVVALTIGLSMGTASGLIGLPLLLRWGAMRHLVNCVAWVMILVIPLVANHFLAPRSVGSRDILAVYLFYLMNLGLVAISLHNMEEQLRLADEDDQTPLSGSDSDVPREREPFDPPAPVGAGWGDEEDIP